MIPIILITVTLSTLAVFGPFLALGASSDSEPDRAEPVEPPYGNAVKFFAGVAVGLVLCLIFSQAFF